MTQIIELKFKPFAFYKVRDRGKFTIYIEAFDFFPSHLCFVHTRELRILFIMNLINVNTSEEKITRNNFELWHLNCSKKMQQFL